MLTVYFFYDGFSVRGHPFNLASRHVCGVKIIYGVKFIWISISNLDPTIIFVILEWLLLVYWSRSISLVFLRGSPLDRRNSYRH